MPRPELFARIEIQGHAVRCLDRDEMAPFRPRLEIEDIGEELGREPFVLRRDDRVIKFDTHLVLPSLFLILSRHRPGRGVRWTPNVRQPEPCLKVYPYRFR